MEDGKNELGAERLEIKGIMKEEGEQANTMQRQITDDKRIHCVCLLSFLELIVSLLCYFFPLPLKLNPNFIRHCAAVVVRLNCGK